MQKAESARAAHRIAEATDHYEKAILIDPEFIAAFNDLASLYLTSTHPESAIAELEEAVRIDSNRPMLFMNLTHWLFPDSQV